MKYYSVTETCRRLNIKPHILRYWEKEFEFNPKRNSAGRRIYSGQQLEKLQLIRHLLHEEKLTVKGARRQLAKMAAQPGQPAASKGQRETLLWLKKELISIRALLEVKQ
jgi:DNA-binding transcriptional MerR regulator